MFLKPANSDTENGILKKFKMSPEKIMYSGNSKTGKVKNKLYQNNTVIGLLPNFKKKIIQFFISKRPASFF